MKTALQSSHTRTNVKPPRPHPPTNPPLTILLHAATHSTADVARCVNNHCVSTLIYIYIHTNFYLAIPERNAKMTERNFKEVTLLKQK